MVKISDKTHTGRIFGSEVKHSYWSSNVTYSFLTLPFKDHKLISCLHVIYDKLF